MFNNFTVNKGASKEVNSPWKTCMQIYSKSGIDALQICKTPNSSAMKHFIFSYIYNV